MLSNVFDTAMESQKARQLTDIFRAIGLDKYIELPQVVSMGDTSSGKSSVLSALSGITFPSSDKITTRCPTELILSKADVFKGKVQLRRKDGRAAAPAVLLDKIEDVTEQIEKLTQLLVNEGVI
jgi:interferon-induced GTP-binding protein Mx1